MYGDAVSRLPKGLRALDDLRGGFGRGHEFEERHEVWRVVGVHDEESGFVVHVKGLLGGWDAACAAPEEGVLWGVFFDVGP
jgi:hypothetical protein